jgi:hypothetical protein
MMKVEFPPKKQQIEDLPQFAHAAVSAGMKPAGAAMN